MYYARTRKNYIDVVRFLYIVLFLYAALMKGMDLGKFKAELGQSPLLMAFAEWITWIVPAIEVVVVLMLIIPGLVRLGLYSSFTLMSVFTFYIFMILNFSDSIPCSCGGILEKMDWKMHLVFNVVFTGLAATAIILIEDRSELTRKASDNLI